MSVQAEVAEVLRLRRAADAARTNRRATAFREAAQDRVRILLLDYGLSEAKVANSLGTSAAAVHRDLLATRERRLGPMNFSSPGQMGRWAREARLRRGLDPAEVGEAIGMNGSWVETVESGEEVRQAGALPALFKTLGVDVRHFAVRT